MNNKFFDITEYYRDDDEKDRGPVLAMAFVNMQPFDKLYPLEKAFDRGTLFESLDKPFCGGGGK